METKKGGTIILVHDMSFWPNTYSYKIAWRYPEWLLSYGVYKNVDGRFWEKTNQRGITWKLRKRDQSFLCATHRPDLTHITVNLHDDILNCYWIEKRTRMFGKISQRGITWKLRKGEQSFLCVTLLRDLIHIPIKLHEDIPNGYWVMECTRMFRDGRIAPCMRLCWGSSKVMFKKISQNFCQISLKILPYLTDDFSPQLMACM